ncbi:nucleotidyltransferase domain-containing protein [Candidatus Pacearchaeota archaeon]|nr:nucleotidyltransferase domain-containing protein [Candidatus Pacearchaeota archaeon]
MLKIINNISVFAENCYRELGIREYSRIMKISPPTSSKILKYYESEGLLKKRKDRNVLLFRANKENPALKDLSRMYWRIKLKELIDKISSDFYNPGIILFGSLSKLEAKKNSDIDLAILSKIEKKPDLKEYEKILKRKVQLFIFKSLSKIPEELRESIINGYLIQGEIK